MKKITQSNWLYLFLFIFSCVILCVEVGKDPLAKANIYLDLDSGTGGDAIYLCEKNEVCEEFYSTQNQILRCIAIRTVTWENTYAEIEKLIVDLYDKESNVLLNSYEIPLNHLPNNELYRLNVCENLSSNSWYTIHFRLDAEEKTKFAIVSGAAKDSSKSHLSNDNTRDLCMVLYVEEATDE